MKCAHVYSDVNGVLLKMQQVLNIKNEFVSKLTLRMLLKGTFLSICGRFPRMGSGVGPGGR